jgi:putative acetyltransferase
MVIRERTSVDDDAIRHLNDAAFGSTDESKLIEDLRSAGLVAVELVAVDPLVEGHILFSVLDVTVDSKPVRGLALAPMAVQPHRQRHGIGSALVHAGLRQAREGRWQAVVVLGHQDYYPRFGFSATLARSLKTAFAGAPFMALELEPGALQAGVGRVVYPPVFGV